ncbi:hypothetical protein SRABI128_00144 [Microbacterium sp. Bi128]|nr:hypothetical protein SRABI128_00144 [Microbacterium sp. Bi128]
MNSNTQVIAQAFTVVATKARTVAAMRGLRWTP